MKKLFLFVLTAMMICGCSKNENENPAPPEEDIFSVDITSLEFSGEAHNTFPLKAPKIGHFRVALLGVNRRRKAEAAQTDIFLSIFLQQAIRQLITAQLHSRSKAENNR